LKKTVPKKFEEKQSYLGKAVAVKRKKRNPLDLLGE